MIIHGDSLHELKALADNSIDFICTDPPYGYSFMGKDWDKAVPSVEIWEECCRVLKPGGFACVMSAPRSDVQQAMTERLINGGFRLDFTPIYWTYASGFPKAGNIGKLVDKRLGAEREKLGNNPNARMVKRDTSSAYQRPADTNPDTDMKFITAPATAPATAQAKALDGSYAGFQPKPAVEVVIVAMKPLSEKTYVDQALANGKGISWLDDGRIPISDRAAYEAKQKSFSNSDTTKQIWGSASEGVNPAEALAQGRFPANLLVSDDVLEDHSKFFDLDAWADTLPFLAVPKASKSEKNKGLTNEPKLVQRYSETGQGPTAQQTPRKPVLEKNHHPTVKPLKLMSYLITLFSRPGDIVLDPFVGSGTTCLAAEQLGRESIGIEREADYVEIAKARLENNTFQRSLL